MVTLISFIFVLAWCTIPTLTGGTISFENCPDGLCYLTTRITFSCELGYHLSGNEQATCVGYGEWDPPVPTCEGKVKCTVLVAKKESREKGNKRFLTK